MPELWHFTAKAVAPKPGIRLLRLTPRNSEAHLDFDIEGSYSKTANRDDLIPKAERFFALLGLPFKFPLPIARILPILAYRAFPTETSWHKFSGAEDRAEWLRAINVWWVNRAMPKSFAELDTKISFVAKRIANKQHGQDKSAYARMALDGLDSMAQILSHFYGDDFAPTQRAQTALDYLRRTGLEVVPESKNNKKKLGRAVVDVKDAKKKAQSQKSLLLFD